MTINRRHLIGGLACAGGLLFGGARPAAAGAALVASYPGILKFAVTRNGAPLGVVMQRFGPDGNDGAAEVYIDFVVSFAGIALYRYEHRARELWRDGRLVALDSVTNDDGAGQAVTARAGADGLRVDGMQGPLTAPPDILPSSYWHPRFVEQRRMLDSQRGRIVEFTIEPVGAETVTALGRPVDAMRYAMRGDIDLDIWYNTDRVWQKMTFSIGGGFIEYTRVAPDASDAGRFRAPLRDGRVLPAA